MAMKDPPVPAHVPGTLKGEEIVQREGREPGRNPTGRGAHRNARDATSINPEARSPIDSKMPQMPPA